MRTLVFVVLFLGLASAVLWGAARAFEAAETHRVTYRFIASALSPLREEDAKVDWASPVRPLVRPFTEADAITIGRTLSGAWQVLALAQENDDKSLLADHFTGIAEERAALSVEDAARSGGRMVVLSQTATPTFFHKDGSLFQASIEMLVARYLSGDSMQLDAIYVTRERGVATLLNEADGWRVMSWERRTAEPLTSTRTSFRGRLMGMNYYPAKTPWREFWPELDMVEVARDFDRILSMNANSVRIFLTRDAFLGESAQASIDRLERLLSVAEAKGVRVVPTLFDLKQDYNLGTWQDDAAYLTNVLKVLKASPAVAFVDLKNEPDLDFEAHGTARVQAWLRTMIALSRKNGEGLALSIGWASAEAAATLLDEVDVVSYHDYAPVGDTATRLADLRDLAKGKPIYVTEIGETSFTLAASFPASETAQAKRLSERIEALQDADGVMVWTLFDFPHVDPSVVGSSPWVKRLQSSFGVLRADGSEKPGAHAVRKGFAGGG